MDLYFFISLENILIGFLCEVRKYSRIAFLNFTFKGQIMNKKSFKSTFQPLEIALKKALGIRKVHKGKIFNESGFALASKEKITRYIFFLPFFQKLRILTNATEFGTQIGGGQNK